MALRVVVDDFVARAAAQPSAGHGLAPWWVALRSWLPPWLKVVAASSGTETDQGPCVDPYGATCPSGGARLQAAPPASLDVGPGIDPYGGTGH